MKKNIKKDFEEFEVKNNKIIIKNKKYNVSFGSDFINKEKNKSKKRND